MFGSCGDERISELEIRVRTVDFSTISLEEKLTTVRSSSFRLHT